MKKVMLLLGACGVVLISPVTIAAEPTGERIFKQLDADNNSMVSEQEYVAEAEKRARRLFKRIDANGDGQLTVDEFKGAATRLHETIEKRREER